MIRNSVFRQEQPHSLLEDQGSKYPGWTPRIQCPVCAAVALRTNQDKCPNCAKRRKAARLRRLRLVLYAGITLTILYRALPVLDARNNETVGSKYTFFMPTVNTTAESRRGAPVSDAMEANLKAQPSSNLSVQQVFPLLKSWSDYNDLKREELFSKIRGLKIKWGGTVYEIRENKEGFLIQTSSDPNREEPQCLLQLGKAGKYIALRLRNGDRILYEGIIKRIDYSPSVEINPAVILSNPDVMNSWKKELKVKDVKWLKDNRGQSKVELTLENTSHSVTYQDFELKVFFYGANGRELDMNNKRIFKIIRPLGQIDLVIEDILTPVQAERISVKLAHAIAK